MSSLLDNLIAHLSRLPGSRVFTANVIISQPRKAAASLFPYAPRIDQDQIHIQDILILVSESSNSSDEPVFVSALQAVLYIFPTTSSLIVYIEKVDSTAQGKRPSPTRTIILAFVQHLCTAWFKHWHMWLHLFARSQNQYLFPASIEFEGKKILSDIGLIKWWKSVLDLTFPLCLDNDQTQKGRKYVSIPGSSPAETAYSLKIAASDSDWTIGNPYSEQNITFPAGVDNSSSISRLIPYFPDDPKARLLDEIANTTSKGSATLSPTPKRRKLAEEDEEEEKIGAEEVKEKSQPALIDYVNTVSSEEFWQRMDIRQECLLSAVGFFIMHIERPKTPSPPPKIKRAEVTLAMLRKILMTLNSYEFGTRENARKSTQQVQQSIHAISGGLILLTDHIPGIDSTSNEAEEAEDGDFLSKYITRSVTVDNPELPDKKEEKAGEAQPVVTVLTARKRKRPNAA